MHTCRDVFALRRRPSRGSARSWLGSNGLAVGPTERAALRFTGVAYERKNHPHRAVARRLLRGGLPKGSRARCPGPSPDSRPPFPPPVPVGAAPPLPLAVVRDGGLHAGLATPRAI